MKRSHPSTPKLERKTVERNRRIHMRNLSNELASLIPPQCHSRVGLSQPHVLEQATDYIKKMEERINELRSRKEYLTTDRASEIIARDMSGAMRIDSTRTMVEVSESGSALNVVLISSLNKDVKPSDVLTVLEEEGTEVLSTNQYFVADKCHLILHSQAKSSRVGYDIERIHKRLTELVHIELSRGICST